jgi:NitT/TauT family transport system substrate-binding protein
MALVVLGLVAACSSKDPAVDAGSGKVDQVTYVTGFGSFGREAYAWYGLDKGYFKAEGIDLKIVPGAGGNQNLKYLDSGQAQFAAIDCSGAIVDHGNKIDNNFKIISAINSNTTIALMSLSSSNITKPTDLPGKKIGVATGAVPKTLFPAFATLSGIPNTVQWVEATPQALPQMLVTHKVDAIGQFVVGKPAVLAAAKAANLPDTINVMPYSTQMTDLYGNVLVAPTKLISSNPDLVKRFNKAYVKSLGASLQDPAGTAQILVKYVPAQKPAPAEAEVKLLAPYVGDGGGRQIGVMDEKKVAKSIALIQSVGLIHESFDPSTMVDFDAIKDLNAAG